MRQTFAKIRLAIDSVLSASIYPHVHIKTLRGLDPNLKQGCYIYKGRMSLKKLTLCEEHY